MKIIKEELRFEENLKKRLEFICEFSKVTPTFVNGSIINIGNGETADDIAKRKGLRYREDFKPLFSVIFLTNRFSIFKKF